MGDVMLMSKKDTNYNRMRVFIILLALFGAIHGKKHKLKVEKDTRKTIDLTTFGFIQGGFLQVNVSGFITEPVPLQQASGNLGFTLSKLESSGMSYLETKQDTCLLQETAKNFAEEDIAVIVFTMDFKNKLVHVQRHGKDVQNMTLHTGAREPFELTVSRRKRSLEFLRDSYLLPATRRKRQTGESGGTKPHLTKSDPRIPPTYVPSAGLPMRPGLANTVPHPGSTALDINDTQLLHPNDAASQLGQSPAIPGVTGQSHPISDVTGQSHPISDVTGQSHPISGSSGQSHEQHFPVHQSAAGHAEISQSGAGKGKSEGGMAQRPPEESSPRGNDLPNIGDKALADTSDIIKDSFSLNFDDQGRASFMFVASINAKAEEGLYELYFHNCFKTEEAVNFSVLLIEKNIDNYLSAGHIPLPTIYFLLSIVFFVLGCFWLYTLKKSTEGVYKIHYLMLTLVYIKALALLFHAINFHFMAQQGHHEEAIAIIYYITYLMRGILLFVTIVLIGAGWAFVKYILSDRDKKIFIIVIPLQVLANVAQIIIEETEEGESQFITWNEIFIIVDLLCCGAILFPVVWSIRHLQEASQTDGKAAISLVKLKLFRHFYIMIVCYIYFTRIIVYLLRIAVPFQYEWMDEFFRELATMVFYIITAYKFRPAPNNPYLQVPQDSDDELEMDEVVTQSGALEGLTKVNVKFSSGNGDSTTAAASTTNKRESSHEYD